MDHIRTYRVRTLHDALRLIRQDLGPDASVLHTREVRGGLLGWRTDLEVTASAELEAPSRFALTPQSVPHAEAELASVAVESAETEIEEAVTYSRDTTDYRRMLLGSLNHTDDVGLDLSHSARNVEVSDDDEPAEDFTPEMYLQELGISRALTAKLFGEEPDLVNGPDVSAEVWNAQLAAAIRKRLLICGPTRIPRGQRTIIALVGPTGVGKTTSLAKLAAGFRLQQHRRVGLVTIDTYRVGAVDQLRTYAEIMDLPMEVVASPRDMREALSRLNECEVVLIDTAGRSPRDPHQMRELGALLAAACPDEVHLVAGATSEIESLHDTVTRFQHVGAAKLLLTKTDEAAKPGKLASFLLECPLPVSYVTLGQNVPDDIRPADSDKLAEWLIGDRDSQSL